MDVGGMAGNLCPFVRVTHFWGLYEPGAFVPGLSRLFPCTDRVTRFGVNYPTFDPHPLCKKEIGSLAFPEVFFGFSASISS